MHTLNDPLVRYRSHLITQTCNKQYTTMNEQPTFLKQGKYKRTLLSRKKRHVTAQFKICLAQSQTHHSLASPPLDPSFPSQGTSGQKTAWLLRTNYAGAANAVIQNDEYFLANYILTIFSDGSFTISDGHSVPSAFWDTANIDHCYSVNECTDVPNWPQ